MMITATAMTDMLTLRMGLTVLQLELPRMSITTEKPSSRTSSLKKKRHVSISSSGCDIRQRKYDLKHSPWQSSVSLSSFWFIHWGEENMMVTVIFMVVKLVVVVVMVVMFVGVEKRVWGRGLFGRARKGRGRGAYAIHHTKNNSFVVFWFLDCLTPYDVYAWCNIMPQNSW